MALLDEILTRLQSEGVGTIGTSLFKYQAPDAPDSNAFDTCVVVRDYLADTPQWVQDSSTPNFERPRFQVLARAPTATAADTLARSAYTALLGLVNGGTLNGARYLSIMPLQSPFFLDYDGNQRAMVAFNVEALRES